MPRRTPTLAERLRAAWSHDSEVRRPAATTGTRPPRADPGSAFAERLRAAIDARD